MKPKYLPNCLEIDKIPVVTRHVRGFDPFVAGLPEGSPSPTKGSTVPLAGMSSAARNPGIAGSKFPMRLLAGKALGLQGTRQEVDRPCTSSLAYHDRRLLSRKTITC